MKKKIATFKARGSNKTIPITKDQFEYILSEFHDRKDIRMEIICHLMFRAIRIGDILKILLFRIFMNPMVSSRTKFSSMKKKLIN